MRLAGHHRGAEATTEVQRPQRTLMRFLLVSKLKESGIWLSDPTVERTIWSPLDAVCLYPMTPDGEV